MQTAASFPGMVGGAAVFMPHYVKFNPIVNNFLPGVAILWVLTFANHCLYFVTLSVVNVHARRPKRQGVHFISYCLYIQ
jgi:hypothetical protein